MAYIGAKPNELFRVAPTKDSFTGDGSTTTFDLANTVPAGGEFALQVFIDNVRQEPGSGKAYTLGADGSGDLKRIRKVPLSYKNILDFSHMRNPINHMCAVFKKSEVLKVGGYKHINGYEDYYLWLRLLKNNKIILNQNLSLVYARIGNNMISRRAGYKLFISEIKFQKLIFNEGISSFSQFIINIFVRAFPRLFGKIILKFMYKQILRNES